MKTTHVLEADGTVVTRRPLSHPEEAGLLEIDADGKPRCRACHKGVGLTSEYEVCVFHYHNCTAVPAARRLSYQPVLLW